MIGDCEPPESLHKAISKRDIEKHIQSLPPEITKLDINFMAKAHSFPFKMVPASEDHNIKNKYLIEEGLKCVIIKREHYSEPDYILREILKGTEFSYDFPL